LRTTSWSSATNTLRVPMVFLRYQKIAQAPPFPVQHCIERFYTRKELAKCFLSHRVAYIAVGKDFSKSPGSSTPASPLSSFYTPSAQYEHFLHFGVRKAIFVLRQIYRYTIYSKPPWPCQHPRFPPFFCTILSRQDTSSAVWRSCAPLCKTFRRCFYL
jgi:hypothetical protein